MKTKDFLHKVMNLAWQMVKRNGLTMSAALKLAWANMTLETEMKNRVVKFYFQKADGSIRETHGTLNAALLHETKGSDRKKSDAVQTYFDTEKQAFRSFKKASLLSIA